nr:MAG TPA: hypothetical protein [Caudoviricetes sp.]
MSFRRTAGSDRLPVFPAHGRFCDDPLFTEQLGIHSGSKLAALDSMPQGTVLLAPDTSSVGKGIKTVKGVIHRLSSVECASRDRWYRCSDQLLTTIKPQIVFATTA